MKVETEMSEPTQAQVLKPCPFCGGQAYKTESVNGSNMVYVGCGPCGVHFKAQKDGTNGVLSKDVVAYWNTRAAERSLAPATPTPCYRCEQPITGGASYHFHDICFVDHCNGFGAVNWAQSGKRTGDALKVLSEHEWDECDQCYCGAHCRTWDQWANHVAPLLAASAAPTPEPTGAEPYIPNFGDLKECVCGHIYYRHFDTYEHMRPVGCKYCECAKFTLAAQPGQKGEKGK